jgi:hypothetical protein
MTMINDAISNKMHIALYNIRIVTPSEAYNVPGTPGVGIVIGTVHMLAPNGT